MGKGIKMEKEMLEKILAILEAQDAKIKALEAQLEAYGGGVDDLVDTMNNDKDEGLFNEFSDRHRSKFDPYMEILGKLEGEDAFRKIYDESKNLSSTEGYDEETYIGEILAGLVETINSLKAIVPPEAQEALEEAEEAIVDAAIETQETEIIEETEIDDLAPDEWSEEELEKEKLEGHLLF